MTPQRLITFLGSWSILIILGFGALLSWHQLRSRAVSYAPFRQATSIPLSVSQPIAGLTSSAEAWAIYSPTTGQLLAGRNVDAELPIASITKLATLLRTRDLPEDQLLTIPLASTEQPPARVGFQEGETASVDTLRRAAAVASANDAAHALGASASSEETYSLKLNLVDATGLSARNTASARTVAQLLDLAWRTAILKPILGLASTEVERPSGNQVLSTTNRLHDTLRSDEVLGGKTGYTDEAGFCLVERFRRGEQELIVVVLNSGAPTRQATAEQVKALATAALDQLVPASQ